MAESESVLLRRYVSGGDTGAFAEIVRRYAGLVYATCLRVLADKDRAADVTQETFFQLMKKGGEITGSLGGWLHRVAVRKAVDSIRRDASRRQREARYLDARSGEDQTWREISPYVDEALNALDDETREMLVCHYLEGRSMTELAETLGVARPTVSRRVDAGLKFLRGHLRKRGILVTVAGLSTLLAENTARSAPAALLQQLGKMTIFGAEATSTAVACTSSSTVVTMGLTAAIKAKLVVAAAAVAVVGAGLVTYRVVSSGPPPVVPGPAVAGRDNTRSDNARTTLESEQTPMPETDPPERPPAEDVAPTQTARALPVAATPQLPEEFPSPMDQVEKDTGFQLDLSSPEATVRSFSKAIASGDAESVMACFLPGGVDYEDIQEMLYADPDDPEQQDEYQMKLVFLSLDPDAEMPMVSVEETEHATSVVWQVTFKKDLPMEGHTFRAGDTWELDATLRQSGDSWLIDNF